MITFYIHSVSFQRVHCPEKNDILQLFLHLTSPNAELRLFFTNKHISKFHFIAFFISFLLEHPTRHRTRCYIYSVGILMPNQQHVLTIATHHKQWCIAKNGGGYTQRGVGKGLKVPCLFMITEVSIRCQKNPEVGIRRIPAYTPLATGNSVVWSTGIHCSSDNTDDNADDIAQSRYRPTQSVMELLASW